MDPSVLKIVGQIAGIGGLALGVFLLLYKDLLRKLKVPGLKQSQWYRVIILFMVLVWSIALVGIVAWVYAATRFSPPISVVQPKPTDPFLIWYVTPVGNRLVVDSFTFPYSDIEKNRGYESFSRVILAQLPVRNPTPIEELAVFRVADEGKVDGKSGYNVTQGGNMQVIVIPNSVITDFGDEHLAFTYVKSSLDQQGE